MHQRKAHPYNYDHIFKTTADITTADGHADSDFNQLATQGEDHYHQMEPPEPDDSCFQGSDDSSSEAGDDVNAFEAGTALSCSRKRSPADKHPACAILTTDSMQPDGLVLGVPQNMPQSALQMIIHPADAVMGLIYRSCDDAGSPKYLADSILKIIRDNNFDASTPSVTKRAAFFNRMSRLIGCKPIEEVSVTLENGKQVKIF